jgi:hypothetical protein
MVASRGWRIKKAALVPLFFWGFTKPENIFF